MYGLYKMHTIKQLEKGSYRADLPLLEILINLSKYFMVALRISLEFMSDGYKRFDV